MAKIDDKQKALADALHAAGHSRFCDKSYSSCTRDAQLNLEGRSHYCDESTLRYFHSRIVYAGDHFHGLIYALVESVALDSDNTRRGYRPVLFDVFGTVISRVTLENAYKTPDAARKAMYAALDALDVLGHYREAIASQRARLKREMAQMAACGRVAR